MTINVSGGPSSAVSAGPPWVPGSGRYYTYPCTPGSGASAGIPSASATYFYPLFIPNACTISQAVVLPVTVSAVTTYQIGLWTDIPTATSGGPGKYIWANNNMFSSGSAGSPQAVGCPVSFTGPTQVWVSFAANQTSTTLRAITAATFITNFFTSGGYPNAYAKSTTTLTATSTLTSASTVANTTMGDSLTPAPYVWFLV